MAIILVTGAAGFIGMHLADQLMARGDRVIGVDNMNDYYAVGLKRDRIARLRQDHGDRFTFLELDFADDKALAVARRDAKMAADVLVDITQPGGPHDQSKEGDRKSVV